jgi:hypothetical protein
LTCSGSACTACDSSYNLYNGNCIGNCPDWTYSSSNVCYTCPEGCSTCSDSTTCESC